MYSKNKCTPATLERRLFRRAASLMQKDDVVKFDEFANGECLFAWNSSATAYHEKKYLKEGRTFVIGRIKDYLTIAAFFIAFTTSITSCIIAIVTLTKNNRQTQEQQVKIDSIQEKLQLQSDILKRHSLK